MSKSHAPTSFYANCMPSRRMFAWCVIALGNFLLPIAAAGQGNDQLLPTIQICQDPAFSFADTHAEMASHGWSPPISEAQKKDAARHISIGVHYKPNANWNEDARRMTLDLPKRLGTKTFTSSTGGEFEGIQLFLRDANGLQYLLLKENVERGPEGTLRSRARKCLIITQPNNELQAMKLRGEKRENWIVLLQSALQHNGRYYSVDVLHKTLAPKTSVLKATELIQIDVRS